MDTSIANPARFGKRIDTLVSTAARSDYVLLGGTFIVWRALLQLVYWLEAFRALRLHDLPQTLTFWSRWDGGWYWRIAKEGYSLHEFLPHQTNVAFFPLYPLLTRIVARSTGMSYGWAALVISNACAFALMFVLYRFVESQWDRRSALLATWALLLFPSSFFLVSMYAESLLLLLMVGSLYLATKERWALASIVAGIACAAAATGLVTAPVLALMYLARYRRLRPDAGWLAFAPSGAVAYAGYLWVRFGTPTVWVHTERLGWGRQARLASFAHDFARWPDVIRGTTYYWGIRKFDRFVLVAFLVVGIVLLVQRRWPLGILTIAVILIPASSGNLSSMNRYALTAFPFFAWLGSVLARRRWLIVAYAAVTLPFLVLFTGSFLRGRWVG